MVRRLFLVCLVFSMFLIVIQVEGQSSRVPAGASKLKYFQIPGRVKLEKGDASGAVVRLIDLDSKQIEKSLAIPSSGKFDLELTFFKEYKIAISKEGYYDKEINVSTVIPRDVWEKDSVFPPFYIVVTLYKKVPGAKLSFEGKSIGNVSYSPNGTLDNFDSNVLIDDQVIQNEIETALKNIDDKDFNQKMAEALEAEKKSDLSTAYSLYSVASKIKPSDKFVKEKLKELASDLKNLGNEAKIQAEYDRLLALGDANVNSLKYIDAIQYYKGALKVKPNDAVAVSKIADAEKLLALAGEKAKKDAEFNRLITAGDANVNQSKYAEAILSFKQALDIRPSDSIALARIADAERQLALAGDKAKKDAEFNSLIAAGDVNVGQTKYTEAILNFKSALGIKPNDLVALARIANAEKQLALAGDKAKQEAEFNRLIASGDANVGQSKYTEAILNFKSALGIKPNDSVALTRIANADKQLTIAVDKAKQEAEFNRLIAAGDVNVGQSKYAEAIVDFKSALGIKPNDSVALTRLAEAEKLLALAGDKVKKDAEFDSLIAAGDVNVGQSKYSEAIVDFKSALGIKPNDSVALARLVGAEKQLAITGDKAKQEAEFNRLIAAGDANVSQSKYGEAIINFKSALGIKPNDSVALARLVGAEKQLAIAGDKAKQEAEFNRLIAAGDANVSQSKYGEAIINFKSALDVKPNDSVALARIANAEKQLALAGDKAKQEAEFNRQIAAGDANFGQTKYTEAILNFKSALGIKPNDSVALARIANAEKQLALAGDKAKQEAEFNRQIAAGDANVGQSKYAEAILNFKSALGIKPNDSVVLARLAGAERELTLAGDKAKKDTEFNRLIAVGDANVGQSKYAEAIIYFKSALDVKPNDSVALARLAGAERELALAGDKAKQEAEFNRLVATGDANFGLSKYGEALTFYKSALKLKSNEVVVAKISETERLMQLAEAERARKESENQAIALKQQKYKEAIDKANQLFNAKNFPESKQFYQQALSIDPAPVYPTERIREIDKIIAQMQSDALANDQETAKGRLYNDAMSRGGTYFTAKLYSEAISSYKDAQKIKPAEILPPQKIKEIQLIIDGLAAKALEDQKFASDKNLSANEKFYLEKIKIADENFKKSQWSVARFYYIEALKFKQADNYSLDKVDACDKMIDSGITDEKMQDYKNKILRADAEMKAKNYSSARFYYRSASDILKWEVYPKEQLKEIDRLVAEKLNESDQKLFAENQNKADEAFNRQEYSVARFYYNKTIEISQSDHVASRLKEIESIVNGSEAKKIDASYADFIKKGDDAVQQKSNSIARFYYQKALALKPNESYPKDKVQKIDSGVVNP